MKMRGKMIDGSPVTFESIDLGGVMYRDMRTGEKGYCAPYVTEFVGEGFYVRSAWNGMAFPLRGVDANAYRLAHERAMLEQAGVDTGTVKCAHEDVLNDVLYRTWKPMWPVEPDTSYLEALSGAPPGRPWKPGEIGLGASLDGRTNIKIGELASVIAKLATDEITAAAARGFGPSEVKGPIWTGKPYEGSVLRSEGAAKPPTWIGTDYTISNAMMDAAMKELDGVLKRLVYVEHGRLVVSNPMRAVTLIWQSMMRAKKTGEAK